MHSIRTTCDGRWVAAEEDSKVYRRLIAGGEVKMKLARKQMKTGNWNVKVLCRNKTMGRQPSTQKRCSIGLLGGRSVEDINKCLWLSGPGRDESTDSVVKGALKEVLKATRGRRRYAQGSVDGERTRKQSRECGSHWTGIRCV
jgi:hypothetical protein